MKFKHLILSAIIMLACAVGSMAQKVGNIEAKYDRFDNTTLVQLDFMKVTGKDIEGIYINAAFKCQGEVKICRPEKIYMGLSVLLEGARYDLSANLTVLADGERFPLGNMLRVQTENVFPERNMISTLFIVAIPRNDFLKIAKSKKVEMQLDTTEFELTLAQRSALYGLSTLATP